MTTIADHIAATIPTTTPAGARKAVAVRRTLERAVRLHMAEGVDPYTLESDAWPTVLAWCETHGKKDVKRGIPGVSIPTHPATEEAATPEPVAAEEMIEKTIGEPEPVPVPVKKTKRGRGRAASKTTED